MKDYLAHSVITSSGIDMQALLVCSLARSLYLVAGSHYLLANFPRSLAMLTK